MYFRQYTPLEKINSVYMLSSLDCLAKLTDEERGLQVELYTEPWRLDYAGRSYTKWRKMPQVLQEAALDDRLDELELGDMTLLGCFTCEVTPLDDSGTVVYSSHPDCTGMTAEEVKMTLQNALELADVMEHGDKLTLAEDAVPSRFVHKETGERYNVALVQHSALVAPSLALVPSFCKEAGTYRITGDTRYYGLDCYSSRQSGEWRRLFELDAPVVGAKECFNERAYNGLRGLEDYLFYAGGIMADGFKETMPLLLQGTPLTTEVAYSKYEQIAGQLEAHKRLQIYLYKQDFYVNPDMAYAAGLMNAVIRLNDKFLHLPEGREPKGRLETLGFAQRTQDEAIRTASRVLAMPEFENPYFIEDCVLKNISEHIAEPSTDLLFERSLQELVFPKELPYEPAAHEELYPLVGKIYSRLCDDLNVHDIAHMANFIYDLAMGGERREQTINKLFEVASSKRNER